MFQVVFDIAFPQRGVSVVGRHGSDLCPPCAIIRLCEQIRSGLTILGILMKKEKGIMAGQSADGGPRWAAFPKKQHVGSREP